MSAERAAGPWRAVRTRLSRNRRIATITTTHLSFFSFPIAQAWDALKTQVLDGLSSGFLANASPPTCADESAARSDGYAITSTSGTTVYWCLGEQSGGRVMRVVNNRRYPIDISHPGISVVSAGSVQPELASLARLVSGNLTVILPRESASFAVSLPLNTYTTLATQLDGVGWSFYQLQVGVDSLLSILTRFGVGSSSSSANVISNLIAIPTCASSLGQSAGDAIAKCLSPALLLKVLGWKGLLLAPIVATGELADFFRSAINATLDTINGRYKYQITVSRRASAVTTTQAPTTTAPVTPPATTTAPSTGTPAQGFAIGAPFDDDCVVAWPTAPTVTSQDIEMTMTCAHVPESDFLFTHVIYADPNLNVTPSTGQMHVTGKVVDIATSAYGYKELVVEASTIKLP
jgi:hypothetical protein